MSAHSCISASGSAVTGQSLTLAQLLQQGRAVLQPSLQAEARQEALWLLCACFDCSRAYLLAHDTDAQSPEQCARYLEMVRRRASGEPFAYITGHREFWTLDLKVTPAVLIPRPDTETLVEAALRLSFASVLDLGTGSGAIILSLKKERPQAQAYACDLSEAALQVAKYNAEHNGQLQVDFRQSNWFAAFAGQSFELIVSNPPYIEEQDSHLTQNGLNFEPQQALVSGPDGLADIRRIVQDAPEHLLPGGHLLIEHGNTQHEAVAELMRQRGFACICGHKDLQGWVRVTQGTWNGTQKD